MNVERASDWRSDLNHRGIELDLTVQGMSCAACAARIEKALLRMDGVEEAAVSFPLRTAWVQAASPAITLEKLADRVNQLGFQAMLNESAEDGIRRERSVLRWRLLAAILLTLPLLLGMLQHWTAFEPAYEQLPAWLLHPWLQLGLATVIQFVIGMPFYFGAYYALRGRSANMDVLVVLGTTAAYLYSHYLVFRYGLTGQSLAEHASLPLYFETSAVVITVVLLGKYIETSAAVKASDDSAGYGRLQAPYAVVERAGVQSEIRAEFVRKGDMVLVERDSIIPIDGLVRQGESSVEEALLTGESAPVPKQAGAMVWAGTLNGSGKLRIETTAAGHDTMLNRVQELVKQGHRSKSSLQTHVDKAAAWFVPLMLLLSLATLLLWGLLVDPGNWAKGVVCAIAVLLAACPCAIGLAAPISLIIASGRMAKRGIIAKDGKAVERLASVGTIILDKTGTLTEGKPRLAFTHAAEGGRAALIRLAASLEADSEHGLARAVKEAARRSGIVATDAEGLTYTSGRGVEGRIRGQHCVLGNASFVEEQGCRIASEIRAAAVGRERLGETVLYLARDKQCIGVLSFSDTVKRCSGRMIAAVRQLGVSPMIATGDHEAAAVSLARIVGITKVRASMLPESKLALVESIKKKGQGVAMVGDGWNDAPALAAADVGIAMGDGTEAALSAGHITLLFPRLMAIPEAIRMSRMTIRNIRQNLVFAFLYNAVIIPFAAIGLLEPWMAGTAMALSSVSVVGNAIRLKRQLERTEEIERE
ncbi:cation-translocating P-type ATPase [Paenibacillus sp. HB172176]|uniref:heavy metal translocating P-type ATPase n=1 Tax=Paenibacillus sp. HB172176 TaxID=2493690 RepID=UPI00143C8711|nr:cation-translocating P-type ATPase [Paenibacillus sp. HB172176]